MTNDFLSNLKPLPMTGLCKEGFEQLKLALHVNEKYIDEYKYNGTKDGFHFFNRFTMGKTRVFKVPIKS